MLPPFVNLRTRPPIKRLKLLLVDRGLELEELATSTGLSLSLVKKIASGDRAPTLRTAARLENFFNVRIFSMPASYRARKWRQQSRTFLLPADVNIEFDKEEEAITAEKEFAGYVVRAGAKISFIKPTPVMIGEREAQ
jgi:transcriptional regulator with XRE-family HTH domain